MLIPRNTPECPNNLPYEIVPLEPNSRIQLLSVLIGSISIQNPYIDPNKILGTAQSCVEHFENISSAIESGFIAGYDETLTINGYDMRVFYPQNQETD